MRVLTSQMTVVRAGTPEDQQKVMYLSGADHFVRPRHVPLLLFYPAPTGAEGKGKQQMIPTELLLASLKQLLVHYPPLSGRLRQQANSSKFELVCNDAGVEFWEVSVDGTLAEFGDFQPNQLFTEMLNPVPPVLSDIFEHPVLYVQVTRFACGSAALVAASIHTITDGLSVNQFITAWSELARGVKFSNPPFHDRTLLKSSKALDPAFIPKELRGIGNISTVAPPMNLSNWPRERMFTFSPAQVKKAKSKASYEGAATIFSSFQSINAHLWKSITKARSLNPASSTKFLTTLDARKRFKPNLPDGYFGNAICFVSTKASAGEIVEQPLSYAAGLIRDAIAGFTEEYMLSVMAFVENYDGPVAMNVNFGDDAGHDVSVASWVQMQFHEVDFGSGMPLLVCPVNNPYDGNVIILPSQKGEGYINVYLSLKPEHMKRLEADPEFFLES